MLPVAGRLSGALGSIRPPKGYRSFRLRILR